MRTAKAPGDELVGQVVDEGPGRPRTYRRDVRTAALSVTRKAATVVADPPPPPPGAGLCQTAKSGAALMKVVAALLMLERVVADSVPSLSNALPLIGTRNVRPRRR